MFLLFFSNVIKEHRFLSCEESLHFRSIKCTKTTRCSVGVQGSGSGVVVLLDSSCRGHEGARNLLQLALKADAPVGNLHQRLCTSIRVIAFQVVNLTPVPSLFDRARSHPSPCLFDISTPPCWREERTASRVCTALKLSVHPGIAGRVLPLPSRGTFELTFKKGFCVGHYSQFICLLFGSWRKPNCNTGGKTLM